MIAHSGFPARDSALLLHCESVSILQLRVQMLSPKPVRCEDSRHVFQLPCAQALAKPRRRWLPNAHDRRRGARLPSSAGVGQSREPSHPVLRRGAAQPAPASHGQSSRTRAEGLRRLLRSQFAEQDAHRVFRQVSELEEAHSPCYVGLFHQHHGHRWSGQCSIRGYALPANKPCSG